RSAPNPKIDHIIGHVLSGRNVLPPIDALRMAVPSVRLPPGGPVVRRRGHWRQACPWALLCLLCLLSAEGQPSPKASSLAERAVASWSVCFVVRTYWRHGAHGDNSLERLLRSLQAQGHADWEALLVVVDSMTFPDLPHLVRGLRDDRIWVFADLVGRELAARGEGGGWADGYHRSLYGVTDEAVRGCRPGTAWVVVTNGDNEYGAGFLEALGREATSGAELVGFDFFSRYYNPTGIPCDRFSKGEGRPPCKENLLKFCHTDLGANAMSWTRLVEEDRRFSALGSSGPAAGQDALMAELLKKSGWRTRRAAGMCLFSHRPNPQDCSSRSGVWDDTGAPNFGDTCGGACLTADQAREKLAANEHFIENVTITLAAAPARMSQHPVSDRKDMLLACLRWKDRGRDFELARFFGSQCEMIPTETVAPGATSNSAYYNPIEDSAAQNGYIGVKGNDGRVCAGADKESEKRLGEQLSVHVQDSADSLKDEDEHSEL
ncbi:unnamed protein product, partial [Ostreobium quekettii]